MTSLPQINLTGTTAMMGLPSAGNLIYRYRPFFNKRLSTPEDPRKDLDFLSVNAAQVKMSSKTPVEITIEEAYDNSANLIINDKKNPPKIGGFFVMWFFSVYYQTTAAQRLTLPIWFIALSLFITALMYCGLIHLCFNKYRKSGD